MKIKLEQGEYTEAELLQKIEEAKKLANWNTDYFESYLYENRIEHDKIILKNNKLFQDMFRFAMLRNDVWKPDWSNQQQEKWGLLFTFNNVIIADRYNNNHLSYGISVKSEEIAQEMLEIFGERIKEIYGKQ